MNRKKKIILTVTNDLTTDQRMQRICSSLYDGGYEVVLVGRKLKSSKSIDFDFHTKRLKGFFNSGFLFYAEYSIRLFFYLFRQKSDAICAIDLDTIIPCLWVSKLKKKPLVYDAHEYYTESPELDNRPAVKSVWEKIAAYAIPKADLAYTVNNSIADFLYDRYAKPFSVVRNLPVLTENDDVKGKYLLYQGVLNEGRGLEELILAMTDVEARVLKIAGNGDIKQRLVELVQQHKLENKVEFLGVVKPQDLKELTHGALLGFNLLDGSNKNYYYSLANKFFDYMMAGVPSICMNFPEYKTINDQYKFSMLIDELHPQKIAAAVGALLSDTDKLDKIKAACKVARKDLNWKKEEQKLLSLYADLFSDSL